MHAVGKSTLTVFLSQTAAFRGLRVGILDADITGPSIPRLLGVPDLRVEMENERILPLFESEGAEGALKRLGVPKLGSIPWVRDLVSLERVDLSVLPKAVGKGVEELFDHLMILLGR
ncbi:MAG: P-loop NTPase [Termitinemataceae bacterium]